MYDLMTFGIPINDYFPVCGKGMLRKDRHLEWLATRRKLELEVGGTKANELISVPSGADVLFGRGKPIQDHAGNLRLNLILESVLAQYNDSTREAKPKIAKQVVEQIKGRGGHFLRPVDGMWERVDDETAKEKVSHTFRSLRSSLRKKNPEETRRKLDLKNFRSSPDQVVAQKLRAV
jgi:hypothetical protein